MSTKYCTSLLNAFAHSIKTFRLQNSMVRLYCEENTHFSCRTQIHQNRTELSAFSLLDSFQSAGRFCVGSWRRKLSNCLPKLGISHITLQCVRQDMPIGTIMAHIFGEKTNGFLNGSTGSCWCWPEIRELACGPATFQSLHITAVQLSLCRHSFFRGNSHPQKCRFRIRTIDS